MIRAIVTDIEGTTSSLSFVKDVLFPYAREHLGDYIQAHIDEPAVQVQLTALKHDAADELGSEPTTEQMIALLARWIDEDRKATPLKALQGLVWEQGYRNGDFFGHIYADAVEVLRRWHAQGLSLNVYSSGSAYAQKLLFAHTEYGDLTPLFDGYFDTRVGAKGEVDSYRRIAEALGIAAHEILFLSDIQSELEAAQAAGFKTWMLVRDGEFDSRLPFHQAHDFKALVL